MIYIATLNRNGLAKIGMSQDPSERSKQLRRELKALNLRLVRVVRVPYGWGTDAEWETELLENVRRKGGHLQLFSTSENSTEVVDCTIEVANIELDALCRKTEIDPDKDAPDHDDGRVDWRFYQLHSRTSDSESISLWRSLCHRQEFINYLRGDKWALIPRSFVEIDLEQHRLGHCAFPLTPIMRFHDKGKPWIPLL